MKFVLNFTQIISGRQGVTTAGKNPVTTVPAVISNYLLIVRKNINSFRLCHPEYCHAALVEALWKHQQCTYPSNQNTIKNTMIPPRQPPPHFQPA